MKKNFKAVLVLVLAFAMVFTMAACGNKGGNEGGEEETEQGKVLNIWCWNDEFQTRFNDYYPEVKEVAKDGSTTTLNDGTVVNWIVEPNDGNNYQTKLDEALLKQADASADEKIDLFLVEADYARKYTNSDATMNVADLKGVLDATSDQYEYTKEVVSDADGNVKGVSWQACPGLIAYRRSIAKDVLGTDDPEKVQEALADWDKFAETAKKMADKGYKMLSGYDDTFRPFYNNDAAPFVEDDKTINIDKNIMEWVKMTKEYTEKGWNNKTSLWGEDWNKDQGKDSKVFCIPACTWEIDFTLTGNADPDGTKDPEKSAWGDYAVCVGPVSWCWGGTWLTAAAGTDNVDLVSDIMIKMTTDPEILNKIATEKGDFVNSQKVIADLAENYEGNDFLGGQNHYALLSDSAAGLSLKIASAYDQGIIETMQASMKDYFDGNADLDKAKANFETAIKEKYPNLETVNWPE